MSNRDFAIQRRRAALRLALRRGDAVAAASAASRLLLPGTTLEPPEIAAIRSSRALLGRALRDARRRRRIPAAVEPAERTSEDAASAVADDRRKRRAIAAAVGLLLGLLVGLFLIRPEEEGGAGAEGTPIVAERPPISFEYGFSRGRTAPDQPMAVVPQAPIVAQPEAQTSAAPATAPAPAKAGTGGQGTGTGTGSGTSGSGSGTGSGSGSGTGRAIAPPPATSPVPQGRIRGRVVDAVTGRGVPGVCVVDGTHECGPQEPYSDAFGYWAIDVAIGSMYDLQFKKPGYAVGHMRVTAQPWEQRVPDVRIRSLY